MFKTVKSVVFSCNNLQVLNYILINYPCFSWKVFFNLFFLLLKCFILQNKHNRDKTKDSTYNITDTKEEKKLKLI